LHPGQAHAVNASQNSLLLILWKLPANKRYNSTERELPKIDWKSRHNNIEYL